jgi:NADH:ubiquinone oxidoreductase subunit 2 (subunit N)
MALRQVNVKRMFFQELSHAGFMLMTLLTLQTQLEHYCIPQLMHYGIAALV